MVLNVFVRKKTKSGLNVFFGLGGESFKFRDMVWALSFLCQTKSGAHH